MGFPIEVSGIFGDEGVAVEANVIIFLYLVGMEER